MNIIIEALLSLISSKTPAPIANVTLNVVQSASNQTIQSRNTIIMKGYQVARLIFSSLQLWRIGKIIKPAQLIRMSTVTFLSPLLDLTAHLVEKIGYPGTAEKIRAWNTAYSYASLVVSGIAAPIPTAVAFGMQYGASYVAANAGSTYALYAQFTDAPPVADYVQDAVHVAGLLAAQGLQNKFAAELIWLDNGFKSLLNATPLSTGLKLFSAAQNTLIEQIDRMINRGLKIMSIDINKPLTLSAASYIEQSNLLDTFASITKIESELNQLEKEGLKLSVQYAELKSQQKALLDLFYGRQLSMSEQQTILDQVHTIYAGLSADEQAEPRKKDHILVAVLAQRFGFTTEEQEKINSKLKGTSKKDFLAGFNQFMQKMGSGGLWKSIKQLGKQMEALSKQAEELKATIAAKQAEVTADNASYAARKAAFTASNDDLVAQDYQARENAAAKKLRQMYASEQPFFTAMLSASQLAALLQDKLTKLQGQKLIDAKGCKIAFSNASKPGVVFTNSGRLKIDLPVTVDVSENKVLKCHLKPFKGILSVEVSVATQADDQLDLKIENCNILFVDDPKLKAGNLSLKNLKNSVSEIINPIIPMALGSLNALIKSCISMENIFNYAKNDLAAGVSLDSFVVKPKIVVENGVIMMTAGIDKAGFKVDSANLTKVLNPLMQTSRLRNFDFKSISGEKGGISNVILVGIGPKDSDDVIAQVEVTFMFDPIAQAISPSNVSIRSLNTGYAVFDNEFAVLFGGAVLDSVRLICSHLYPEQFTLSIPDFLSQVAAAVVAEADDNPMVLAMHLQPDSMSVNNISSTPTGMSAEVSSTSSSWLSYFSMFGGSKPQQVPLVTTPGWGL